MSDKKISDDVISVENLPVDIVPNKTYHIAQQNPNTLTHIYFKYPCRFIPEIPRFAIKKYIADKPNSLVFDPFAGSGTTVLEANINGHDALCAEIDDIAKLLIKVKTTTLNDVQLKEIILHFENILSNILYEDAAKIMPQIDNLEHWFNKDNINYLGKMLCSIKQIEDDDIRDFFKVCFISIIKKVSNADDISPKPYVSKKITKIPADPIKEFQNIFTRYYEAIKDFSELGIKASAQILDGDALNFKLKKNIDLAITSPPYINAFDYGRILRLENLWLGTLNEKQLREKKKKYVGTEKIKLSEEEQQLHILDDSELLLKYFNTISLVDKKRALIVKKFFQDMKTNLIQTFNYLSAGGHYMIVIGDSQIRGVTIESWKVINDLASQVGFEKELYFKYVIQNPYIRIPRANKGGIIKYDNVLILKKGK